MSVVRCRELDGASTHPVKQKVSDTGEYNAGAADGEQLVNHELGSTQHVQHDEL